MKKLILLLLTAASLSADTLTRSITFESIFSTQEEHGIDGQNGEDGTNGANSLFGNGGNGGHGGNVN